MSNSPLVNQTILTMNRGNYDEQGIRHDGRWYSIDKITIHHTAGVVSADAVARSFVPASRGASANYIVGGDGTVVMSVEEKDRAWTSGSATNDNRAITIEVCNSTSAPSWEVSDTALRKVIELCADICKRNNIKKLNFTGDATGNLTMHKYFQATNCPGPYLGAKFPYITDQVNAILSGKPIEPIIETATVTYQAYSASHGWLAQISDYDPNGVKTDGYAGWRGFAIQGIRCYINNFTVKYRAHLRNGGWLSWIDKADNTDEGYAGWYGNDIDGIQMTLVGAPAGYHIEYRTSLLNGNWLSWIRDYGEGDNGYSGWFGKSLDRLQVRIVKDGTSTAPAPTTQSTSTTPPSTTHSTPITAANLKVGDKVRLKSNATYFNGKPIPSFVFSSTLYVRGIRTDGTIIISTQATGAVTGIVKPDAIEGVEIGSRWPAVPFVVRIKNLTSIKAGPSANDSNKGSLSTGAFTITSVSGDYGRLKSGVGWIDLNDVTIL